MLVWPIATWTPAWSSSAMPLAHPSRSSGQGWNLALRDVAAVAEIVVDRLRLGLDPGDATALERYAGWRRFDRLALVAITDGINRLFANDIFPLRLAPRGGLGHGGARSRRRSGSSCGTPWVWWATCRGRCAGEAL